MRSRIWVSIMLAVVLTGCSTEESDTIFGSVSIAGGGFSDTGVDGFGNLDLPDLWTHMFGRLQESDDVNGVRECRDEQRCGVGGVVEAFGLLTGPSDSFAVVTTGDFLCDNNLDDCCEDPLAEVCVAHNIPVLLSGVQTFARTIETDDGQTWTGAALLFDYTLLSARANPAGAADSVIVRLLPTGGTATTVLRLTADDLTDLPLHDSGCGTQPLPALGGTETSYPTCSEWSERRVDITPFLGQEVSIQFIAGEAGAAIALAFDNVRIEVSR
jgi:hypothetical protein